MDAGRVLLGVLQGVAFGVELVLLVPTRDFLDELRGVILLLRKDLTGVERSSWEAVLPLGVLVTLLRTVRVDCELLAEAIEGASRGVMGVFAVRVVASVGFNGRPLLFAFERSAGIVWRCRRGLAGDATCLAGWHVRPWRQ